MSLTNIEVSLIIPAYNEEPTIETLLTILDQILEKTGLIYEIIVVNDGSKDKTKNKVLNVSHENNHVKVVSYNVNRGKGYALKKGFSYAHGNAIVFIDSDLDISPHQIYSYIKALDYGDVVISSKHHPHSDVEVPFSRKFLSYGFNYLVRLLTGLTLSDTQTGLKAIRRKPFESIFAVLTVGRFAFDVEFLTVANLYGLKIIEMPVKMKLTNKSFSPVQMWKMFMDLLCISYNLRVIKWYSRIKPVIR